MPEESAASGRHRHDGDRSVPGDGRPDPVPETAAPEPEGDGPAVTVTVVRSGGFAGLTRRWEVESGPRESERWVVLITSCPWDEPVGADPGADRFVWTIDAVAGPDHRSAELPDAQVLGPWRALIDAVRHAGSD